MGRSSIVIALLAVPLAVCGGAGPSAPESDSLAASICDAAAAASDGRSSRAASMFEDVHPALHTLADDLADTDRQTAGSVLRAKEKVEATLRESDSGGDGDAAILATDLRALARMLDGSATCA